MQMYELQTGFWDLKGTTQYKNAGFYSTHIGKIFYTFAT